MPSKRASKLVLSLPEHQKVEDFLFLPIYGRNQSGCEKARNVGFLPFIIWAFLTIFIFVALMKLAMCFKQLQASHIMLWDS